MPIFDSQVHAYERNHPGRPWVGTLQGPAEVTGDQMVAAMDEVGVDGETSTAPSTPTSSIAATIWSPVTSAGPCNVPTHGRPGWLRS